MRFACLSLLALASGAAAYLSAQETRGMIFGRVLDPSAAPVPAASVVVTNTDTNTVTRLEANQTGYYEANLLLPGQYQVSAEAPGFRTTVRKGIVLTVSTRLEIDVRLELGQTTETVQVTAEAPMLDTSAVASGRIMDNRNLMDLPVSANTTTLLVRLATGVQTSGTIRSIGPESVNSGSDYNTAGKVGGNEWAIDGAPNNGGSRRTAYMPYSDTIQEFKVETSNFDASVGHTTGVVIAMMSKSGANDVHGSLTEQHWQQRWNGTPFFPRKLWYQNIAAAEAAGDKALADKLRNTPKQPTGHSNNYAAAVSGPVTVPHVYNGKDKMFFFFAFNGFKNIKSEELQDINRTIPTLANRKGDFSQLLNVDPVRYQIYDPLSVRPDPARSGHFIRDPIAGNILPQSRIVNPVYNTYLKFLPNPNNDPTSPKLEPLNNYQAFAAPSTEDYKAFSNRVDYHHSTKHHFYGRWSWNDYLESRLDWSYEALKGLHDQALRRHNIGAAVDWVYTMNAATVLDVAIAGNEFREGYMITVPLQYKPSDVGLPAYIDAKAGDLNMLPQMTFSGYESLGRADYPAYTRFRTFTGRADFSHVRGNHTARAGMDVRQHFRTGGYGGSTSGRFGFSNSFTRRNDDTFTPAGDLGLSWAAFMMGVPNSIVLDTNDSYATNTPYYAWYGQDNWRITRRLTLNLGLRLEYEMGPTERFNRMIAGFDPNVKLPITDAAQAAYARASVPELAASSFVAQGGSLYAGVGGAPRRLFQNEFMWLPRIGLAFQLTPRTVLRGGYGLFYDTLNVLNFAPDQTGYSRATSTNVTNDFGMTWLAGDPRKGVTPMQDPFPVRSDGTRFDSPTREKLGLMARTGRGWSYIDFNSRHARQQRWRIGVQRQIGANMLIEAAYAGSRSDRVNINRSLSPLPAQFWADGMVRNDAVANNMNANVTNPFRLTNFSSLAASDPLAYQNLSSLSFFTSSTIRKNQLLRPYPQMNGLTQSGAPVGKVQTDALELSFERRFSKGFTLNLGYARLRDDNYDYYHNEFDAAPSWRPSNDGRPHRLIGTGIWALPFGKGRALASSGIPSKLFGGFQIALTYEYQPGPLIDFGNLFYYGNLDDINTGPRTLDHWFNTANFERNSAKAPAAYHRRVFPTRIDGLRADMTNHWNGNVLREFRIKERTAVQIRVDALNLQNRSQFAAPSANPLSTNFAVVTAQSSTNKRFLQFQARIRF